MDQRIKIALAVLGFFCIIMLYAAEIPYFNRYFSFVKFLGFSLVFGLLVGGLAAWKLGAKIADPYDRMRLSVGLVVAGLLFGPLVFSLLNRHLDPWGTQLENVEFVEIEERYSSRYGLPDTDEIPEPNASHLYFYRNSELTRIVFNKKLDLGDVDRGDLIGLNVRKGLFGMEWVKSVRSPNGGLDVI
ncbi:hypothetical protein [Flavilitoribacter nigricans]|uniref:Uncharacterized protein n=1 Tax=Flavilitoribacter nigricans (strain ATCC 23147 / DSM 23189 / NBRC 102662 / NCIMB 1420 / SS-2) TaxID=1122177 RepID=A0A2D0NIX4_FLAN2|nr:hypothetical protein [Flavilitoribacter nigricans]PHN08397.1 hypothetical protein CRP01_00355 [Flavilitoribacter nigricans DSM 23189 = NBRC 102662]